MSLRPVLGDIALPVAARGAGTYASGPIANAGNADVVLVMVHVTAVSGSTKTLDVVLQTSPDNSTWTSIASSAITQMTAAGSAQALAAIDDDYVQVLATVAGTGTPIVTCQVSVMVIQA
jgi:hypothetical protein